VKKQITAIIVDDEPLARLTVRDAISDFPRWRVLAEFENANTLLHDVRLLSPDVIFLDISMPGKSGIEVAMELIALNEPPHIVFITAYDNYAVQAFELYAVDYLLKPFDPIRFSRCIERIQGRPESTCTTNDKTNAYLQKQPIDKLIIKSTGSIRVIEMRDVYWFGANGNYVEVHHRNGCHLHRGSLLHLEESLNKDLFCRVHRQVIIKLDQARELKSISENKNTLRLKNDDWVSVSERYKHAFLARWT